MEFQCNDATARMIEAFRRNNGQEALANLCLMWASMYDLYDYKLRHEENSEPEEETICFDGLNILTKLIVHLNE